MKLLVALIIFRIANVHCENIVPHKDCGSPNAQLVKVEFIPPCEKHACILRRGEVITVLANFLPRIHSNQIIVSAYQKDAYLSYETPMIQKENLCGKFNITCPLEPNQMQYAVVSGTFPQNFPGHKTTFRLIFYGDNDQTLFCETCPIEIR